MPGHHSLLPLCARLLSAPQKHVAFRNENGTPSLRPCAVRNRVGMAKPCEQYSKRLGSDCVSLVGDVLHTTRNNQLGSQQEPDILTRACASTKVSNKYTGRPSEISQPLGCPKNPTLTVLQYSHWLFIRTQGEQSESLNNLDSLKQKKKRKKNAKKKDCLKKVPLVLLGQENSICYRTLARNQLSLHICQCLTEPWCMRRELGHAQSLQLIALAWTALCWSLCPLVTI